MSRADDDMDDEGLEGLGSFRAMFREMPDEEPPQRGLAELMAAARVKAEEMAKPSLWERFLQTMRRPQVMALATIMILIGGAVFISQRKSEMDASPTASQSYDENAAAPTAQTVATGAAGSGMAFGAEQDTDKRDGEAADQGAAEPATDRKRDEARVDDLLGKGTSGGEAAKAEATRAAPERSKMDAKPSPKTATSSATKAPPKAKAPSRNADLMLEGGFDDDGPTTGSAPAGASTSAGPMAGAGGGGAVGEAKSGAGKAPAQTKQAPSPAKPAPVTAAPTASPIEAAPAEEKTATATTPPANKQQALTVQQLHANAKKLATAGDCAQVRTIAKQIAAKDPTYYRANIATDATLATCLK